MRVNKDDLPGLQTEEIDPGWANVSNYSQVYGRERGSVVDLDGTWEASVYTSTYTQFLADPGPQKG